jgi:hypothetical protein
LYQQTVIKAFETAEKENDTIYHDTVPPENKIPPLEKKAMVKPTPLPEGIRLAADKDPFSKIVPFGIAEKLSIYQVKKTPSCSFFVHSKAHFNSSSPSN